LYGLPKSHLDLQVSGGMYLKWGLKNLCAVIQDGCCGLLSAWVMVSGGLEVVWVLAVAQTVVPCRICHCAQGGVHADEIIPGNMYLAHTTI
jgi:hypothetical protein